MATKIGGLLMRPTWKFNVCRVDLEQRRVILCDARNIAIRIRDIAATMPDCSRCLEHLLHLA
jgi:hypothetical protein